MKPINIKLGENITRSGLIAYVETIERIAGFWWAIGTVEGGQNQICEWDSLGFFENGRDFCTPHRLDIIGGIIRREGVPCQKTIGGVE